MSEIEADYIRFDRFMESALHDPDSGYYASRIQDVGEKGDFSTTSTLSPILSRAVVASFLKWQRDTNSPLHFIEVGGGNGAFAKQFLKALPFFTRLRTKYHLVDSSTSLREIQSKKLGSSIQLHSKISTALSSCNGTAFIFSNELVDAFPVRIFQRNDESWHELYLKGTKEKLIEVNTLPSSSSFKTPLTEYNPKQRIEIHESYYHWLEEWQADWISGQILTIDYGDIIPDLYYRRPNGSLRAYSHHQMLSGLAIYQNAGHQDITADVNFSDLMLWGESLSMKTIGYSTQAEFLTPHASESPEDSYLTDPHGPGSAFKVLLQEKL